MLLIKKTHVYTLHILSNIGAYMDIKEFIFYENRKDKTFTQKKMAQLLGVSAVHLSQIICGRAIASSSLAYKIEQLTEGKVSGWELIKNHITKNLNSK